MSKSGLTKCSSIDHDLFPLLTVRTCVSEADESKNGPRFCAEDKMTGAAYEVRSRPLPLQRDAAEPAVDALAVDEVVPRRLSQGNLLTIRSQQARIDALLDASARGAVPASVALPIDIYIQEQPSTGDTYVASVDAFAGLSLGDIIRSGWGVMETNVFHEVLDAVESFGCASALLPPHGNLSADAIKQLLIVRDGAAEALQPSRWVVSDWLLLSDMSVLSFEPTAFLADLEWVLHSSFAQLRISTTSGRAYLSAVDIEDAINFTIGRIRASLIKQKVLGQQTSVPTVRDSTGTAYEGCNSSNRNSAIQKSYASPEDIMVDSTNERHGATSSAHQNDDDTNGYVTLSAAEELANGFLPDEKDFTTAHSADSTGESLSRDQQRSASSSTSAEEQADRMRHSGRPVHDPELDRDPARHMNLKDKMAYHQAALRREQALVTRQRRKNAPLPPRPAPAVSSARRTASAGRARHRAEAFRREEEEFNYWSEDAKSAAEGMPMLVKPSAYLTRGRRASIGAAAGTADDGTTSGRRLLSPRSGRRSPGEPRSARELSRSSGGGGSGSVPRQRSQGSTATGRQGSNVPSTPRDQQREQLIDDVVSMAVLNRRHRGQDYRDEQETNRLRREQRQQALLFETPPRDAAGEGRPIPAVLQRRRVSLSTHVVSSPSVSLTQGGNSAAANNSTAGPSAGASSVYGRHSAYGGRYNGTAQERASETRASAEQSELWQAASSASPEPTPPTTTIVSRVPAATAAGAAAKMKGTAPVSATVAPSWPVMTVGRAAATTGAVRSRAATVTKASASAGEKAVATSTVATAVSRRPITTTKGRTTIPVASTKTPAATPRETAIRGSPARATPAQRTAFGNRPASARKTAPINGSRSARGAPDIATTSTVARTASKTEANGTKVNSVVAQHVEEIHREPSISAMEVPSLSSPHRSHITAAVAALPPSAGGLGVDSSEAPHAGPPPPPHPILMTRVPSSARGGSRAVEASPRLEKMVPRLSLPTVLLPPSARASPREPQTTRPPQTPVTALPRHYRRTVSAGAIATSGTRKASPRVLARSPRVNPTWRPSSTVVEGKASGRKAAASTLVSNTPALRSTRPASRRAVDVDAEKAFAVSNRKPMHRLVPENVKPKHFANEAAVKRPQGRTAAVKNGGDDAAAVAPPPANTSHRSSQLQVAQDSLNIDETPQACTSRSAMNTPFSQPTKAKRATTAAEKAALHHRASLRLGNVRPVDETSPGILMRHRRLPTA